MSRPQRSLLADRLEREPERPESAMREEPAAPSDTARAEPELPRLLGNQRLQRRLAERGGQAAEHPRPVSRERRLGVAALIQPDGSPRTPDGAMRKTEFLVALESEVTRAAEDELRGTGRSTEGCPWIAYWFRYYQRHDEQHLARAIERYAPEAAGAENAREAVALVRDRVRLGVRRSLLTGQLQDLPPGIPPEAFLADSPAPVPVGEPATDPFGLAPAREEAPTASANAASDALRADLGLGEGRPLDTATRSRMEGAFGADLSDVRMHTDAAGQTAAGRQHSPAFAIGSDIALGPGGPAPGTPLGDALLAHELAHVLQQRPASQAARASHATVGGGAAGRSHADAVRTAPTAAHSPLEADANRAAAGAVGALHQDVASGNVGPLHGDAGRNVLSADVAAASSSARPAVASPLRISRCGGPADDPSVAKTVQVKPIRFFGSTENPDDDIAFGNASVWPQANLQLSKQPERVLGQTETESFLGPDHSVDTQNSGQSGEEQRLRSVLGSDDVIPMCYVKEVKSRPDGVNPLGEQIPASCGSRTVVAVENGIHAQGVNHEIGHALGLEHKPGDEPNLMYPHEGSHRTNLDPGQITTVRTSRFAQ